MDARTAFFDTAAIGIAIAALALAVALAGCANGALRDGPPHFNRTFDECLADPYSAECSELFRYCDQNPDSDQCNPAPNDPIPMI